MNELDIFTKYIPNAIVYDIGAHVGLMSRYFIENGASYVYAFEPSIYNYSKLLSNTKNLNVSCFNIALHEKEYSCETRFRDCTTNDETQPIKYFTLENFISQNQIPLPDFIKLDIEGMESLVLNTFDFLFKEKRPVIYIEIHAARKGNTIQNYLDNPHWRWPEEGGFDFNKLKNFNYKIILNNEIEINKNVDYNPEENSHTGYTLIPF
jgi:FkbM family methyltransferase